MRTSLVASLVSAVGFVAACGDVLPDAVVPPPCVVRPTPAVPAVTSISLKAAGVNPAWMLRSADACQDFYQFACGGLLQTVEIPPDKVAWGPIQELQEQTEAFLRATLEQAAKQPGDDPVRRKLGAWYGACMNEDAVEKRGLQPLKPLLDTVAKISDVKTLHAALIVLHKHRIFPLFGIASQQDLNDATRVIVGLDQDGLGLPDRDDYLAEDPKTQDIRAFYQAYGARLLGLANDSPDVAKKTAADILRLETALAKLAQDKLARRDPHKVYNKVDRKGLAAVAPHFPWDEYFKGLGFPGISEVNLNSVAYFHGIDALMVSEKPDVWRRYLRFVLIASQSERLGQAFVNERFALHAKLYGQKAIEPRWKRCVQATENALGELLAQEYVKAKFDAESKLVAVRLLNAVRAAMKAQLVALPWMDAATRAAAEEKVSRMNDKIGYPSRWKTYDFPVSDGYAANALAADAFELARSLKKVGFPVDREAWQVTPPTVDAYYDASLNEMVFPAGILQPPLFDKSFILAANFGAAGVIMGHELTHGFDDEGSQFDGAGNLRNWWTEATQKRFEEQTACVVDQYAAYEAVPGVKLNGKLTAGENLADIGGLKLAFAAYREARKDANETMAADGFTEDQMFFLAYAQSWCQNERPESLERMAKTNPHAPPRHRVNGALADVPAFADAFSCKEGQPMRPAKTCAVW